VLTEEGESTIQVPAGKLANQMREEFLPVFLSGESQHPLQGGVGILSVPSGDQVPDGLVVLELHPRDAAPLCIFLDHGEEFVAGDPSQDRILFVRVWAGVVEVLDEAGDLPAGAVLWEADGLCGGAMLR